MCPSFWRVSPVCATRTTRATMSAKGQSYADAHYGDQNSFVESLAHALGAPVASAR